MLYLGYGLLLYVLIYNLYQVSFNFHLTCLQLNIIKMFIVQQKLVFPLLPAIYFAHAITRTFFDFLWRFELSEVDCKCYKEGGLSSSLVFVETSFTFSKPVLWIARTLHFTNLSFQGQDSVSKCYPVTRKHFDQWNCELILLLHEINIQLMKYISACFDVNKVT